MTVAKVLPHALQMGDTILMNKQPVIVKYIDGPDRNGAYDVYTLDQAGIPHQDVVTDTVTLVM